MDATVPTRPPTFRPPTIGHRTVVRASAADRGYDARWADLSRLFRRRHPLCHYCQLVGRIVAATCVDHYLPHRHDASLMYDWSNLRAACTRCNSAKRDTPGPAYERRVRENVDARRLP